MSLRDQGPSWKTNRGSVKSLGALAVGICLLITTLGTTADVAAESSAPPANIEALRSRTDLTEGQSAAPPAARNDFPPIQQIGPVSLMEDGSDESDGEPTVGPTIVNGSPVSKPNPYQWFALLLIEVESRVSMCGSVLIHPSWLLTAAHCLDDEVYGAVYTEEILPYVGITELADRATEPPRSVANYFVHPNYNPFTSRNDLALIRLTSPVPASKATPVRLAKGSTNTSAGTSVRALGFGQTAQAGPISASLRIGQMRIQAGPGQPCGIWASTFASSVMTCAIGQNPAGAFVSVCRGDSGGPLFSGSGASTRLIGLTSFGSANRCNDPNLPPVFTRVSAFRPWISGLVPLPPLPSGNPVGTIDSAVRSSTNRVLVQGWAIDPDAKDPVRIEVRANGQLVGSAVADRRRGDVGAAYPWYGANHGFRLEAPVSGRSPATVCVSATNFGPGTKTQLGCRSVRVR